MDPELKSRWVAALESGKYTQADGYLNSSSVFCCLGVLCDVIDPDGWELDTGTSTKRHVLTENAFDLGNYAVDLGISDSTQGKLIDMNDSEGKTFPEIATWIKENL